MAESYVVESISFILAIIGSVTGTGSLVWQIITWRHDGPIIRVTPNRLAPITAYDKEGPDRKSLITITAYNSGRAPVTIRACELRLPGRAGHYVITERNYQKDDPLPYRLEGGSSGSWHLETDRIVNICKSYGVDYQQAIACVILANGRIVKARRWERGIGLGPGYPWANSST